MATNARTHRVWWSLSLVVVLAAGACTDTTPAGGGAQATRATTVRCTTSAKAFPSPLPTEPAAKRVDLVAPTFSNPTRIDNPLFPITGVTQLLQLGTVDGLPFRSESTLLPTTKKIPDANGRTVETAIVQYVAYLDGRIHEVALDWYAQADDGSVWYFGEDVFNYEDGKVADTNGTWISCKDGPPGMIMPADPKVGDVYRPENIPGYVFEEVTVRSIGSVANGPLGRVPGAIVVRELHMDGAYEGKTFAPGYGEFATGGGGDSEVAAVAVPTDATGLETPAELETISAQASATFYLAGAKRWTEARAALERMTTAWNAYLRLGPVNSLVKPLLERGVADLDKAIGSRDAAAARQASLDIGRANLDLQMYHRPPAEIDLARIELWTAQAALDAGRGDAGGAASTVVILERLWERAGHAAPAEIRDAIGTHVRSLRTAIDANDLATVATVAGQLRGVLRSRK